MFVKELSIAGGRLLLSTSLIRDGSSKVIHDVDNHQELHGVAVGVAQVTDEVIIHGELQAAPVFILRFHPGLADNLRLPSLLRISEGQLHAISSNDNGFNTMC